MNTNTTTTAPARLSLWTVTADAAGEVTGQGKPLTGDALVVLAAYRMRLAQGMPAASLRITEAGKRPDGLGRRR